MDVSLRLTFCLLVFGLTYGAAISGVVGGSTVWIDNMAAILFIALSSYVYFRAYKYLRSASVKDGALILLGMAAPVGILLALAFFGATQRHLWVSDSVLTHAPSAEYLLSVFRREVAFDALAKEAILKPGAVTHAWVALWYMVFGVGPVVETLSLLVLKALTLFFIVRAGPLLWTWMGVTDNQRGRLGVILYIAAPSVLFHTMAFYKEAAVHLFVSSLLFGVMLSALRPSWSSSLLVLISVGGLVIERFYLAAVFLPVLIWAIWVSLKRWKIIPSALIAVTVACVFYFRREAGNSLSETIEFIKNLRTHHASFDDISYKFNYEIPYVVAVFKTLVTPIWSPDKLTMFKGASALITWGSFVHQLTMMFYVGALFHLARIKQHRLRLHLQIPFFIFVLVAAYVSPWAGRIRDSFYPFLVLYAVYYLQEHFAADIAKLRARISRPRISPQ